jgi:hypothetical protein
MKMTNIIVGIILADGLVICLSSCKNKSTASGKQTMKEPDTAKSKVPNYELQQENKVASKIK